MKVYISADIEGVAGIAHFDEATKTHPDYDEFRQRMTREVAAAAEAALDAGATEVWIKDAHATGRNLFVDALPRAVRLIRGWSGHPLSMVQELDASFGALMMIGYHARAGSGGNPLAHTMSSRVVNRIVVNGRPASEFLLHAYAGALFEVPTVMVAGDEALCAEVAELDPGIRTVATMRGVGDSTVSVHPDVAVDGIRAAVTDALQDVASIRTLAPPETLTVDLRFVKPMAAYRASHYPGATLVDDDTIRFETRDWFEVMRLLLFVL
ncbi:MAG: M55 family metallopeptidase [Myxococcota bacterium]